MEKKLWVWGLPRVYVKELANGGLDPNNGGEGKVHSRRPLPWNVPNEGHHSQLPWPLVLLPQHGACNGSHVGQGLTPASFRGSWSWCHSTGACAPIHARAGSLPGGQGSVTVGGLIVPGDTERPHSVMALWWVTRLPADPGGVCWQAEWYVVVVGVSPETTARSSLLHLSRVSQGSRQARSVR